MQTQEILDQIPDSAKVVVAASAPMASLFGLTVEEWSYVLSAIVACMFIIEKLVRAYLWWKARYNENCKCK
jgi:hypothetical protein